MLGEGESCWMRQGGQGKEGDQGVSGVNPLHRSPPGAEAGGLGTLAAFVPCLSR